jgi:imidazolonepropionase-like amidohydrolase
MPRPSSQSVGLLTSVTFSIALVAAACTGGAQSEMSGDITVFEGARVIVGDGSAPIEDAILVVEGDRISVVGPRAAVTVPAGATTRDLTGKTVMPAIVNAHVHLPTEREGRTELLQHMAYYGAGTVISLGHDSGTVAFAMRDEIVPNGARALTAGRGITSREPGRSDVPYWVTTDEEARSAVRELAAANVDFVKIWVDDRNGQFEKLSPRLYGAVIDEAHSHVLRVTAHIFSLEDAKGLLRAGIDAFAHSIRDRDVDQELVDLWLEHPDVVLVPNLPNSGLATDLSWLSGTVPADELAEMQNQAVDRPDAQEGFGIQARNLKRLSDAGIPVAFGTDGSSPWAVHLEMEDMVRAGLTPLQVISAATSTSAQLLEMTDVGTLASGMSADFVVLDASPLDDITNTRRIDSVYLRGALVDRDALEATATP